MLARLGAEGEWGEKVTRTCSPGGASSSAKVPGPVLPPQHVTAPLPTESTTSRSSGQRADSSGSPTHRCDVTCSKLTSPPCLLLSPAPGPLHLPHPPAPSSS